MVSENEAIYTFKWIADNGPYDESIASAAPEFLGNGEIVTALINLNRKLIEQICSYLEEIMRNAISIIAFISVFMAGPGLAQQQDISSTTQPLLEGTDDVGNPTNNSVVQVNGCTGTLITEDIVLTSGHCITNRDQPAGTPTLNDGCGNWQRFDQFYQLSPPINTQIRFGHDSENILFNAQADKYSLIGCVDIIMLKLTSPVPPSIAIPAVVATRPLPIETLQESNLQIVGWGTSGLEDLWKRDAGSSRGVWSLIGHANLVTGMAQSGGSLFAATEGNRLWMRSADGSNVIWRNIGHANDVVAMTAIEDNLFAATSDNKLWVRNAIANDVNWRHIGHANNVTAMAGINGKIFATTSDNKLWARDPVLSDVAWTNIGHANGIVAMAASNGRLFGATATNNLWSRSPVLADVDWQLVGTADRLRSMAGTDTELFASNRPETGGFPINSMRFRQVGITRLSDYPCDGARQLCVRSANGAQVRPGDSGGALFLLRPGQPRVLIGVTRQTRDGGDKFVATFYSRTSNGIENQNTGIWIERMAGPETP